MTSQNPVLPTYPYPTVGVGVGGGVLEQDLNVAKGRFRTMLTQATSSESQATSSESQATSSGFLSVLVPVSRSRLNDPTLSIRAVNNFHVASAFLES